MLFRRLFVLRHQGYHYSMTTDPENHDPGSSNLCYSMTHLMLTNGSYPKL